MRWTLWIAMVITGCSAASSGDEQPSPSEKRLGWPARQLLADDYKRLSALASDAVGSLEGGVLHESRYTSRRRLAELRAGVRAALVANGDVRSLLASAPRGDVGWLLLVSQQGGKNEEVEPTVWDATADVLGGYDTKLAILETHWGRWEYHLVTDRIRFADSVPAEVRDGYIAADAKAAKAKREYTELGVELFAKEFSSSACMWAQRFRERRPVSKVVPTDDSQAKPEASCVARLEAHVHLWRGEYEPHAAVACLASVATDSECKMGIELPVRQMVWADACAGVFTLGGFGRFGDSPGPKKTNRGPGDP